MKEEECGDSKPSALPEVADFRKEKTAMITWTDVLGAAGALLLTCALSIVLLVALLVTGHGVTCCWEPLDWILAGMYQLV
jgi:hypothetical protein